MWYWSTHDPVLYRVRLSPMPGQVLCAQADLGDLVSLPSSVTVQWLCYHLGIYRNLWFLKGKERPFTEVEIQRWTGKDFWSIEAAAGLAMSVGMPVEESREGDCLLIIELGIGNLRLLFHSQFFKWVQCLLSLFLEAAQGYISGIKYVVGTMWVVYI